MPKLLTDIPASDLRKVARNPSVDQFVVLDAFLSAAFKLEGIAAELENLAEHDTADGKAAQRLRSDLEKMVAKLSDTQRRMSGAERGE